MREEAKRWHLNALSTHQNILFETLIYPHHIVTESVKSIVFETCDGLDCEPIRGFFAVKENKDGKKVKYFIEEELFEELPIRADNIQELYFADNQKSKSVVIRPINPSLFRIRPTQTYLDMHQFIDEFVPFQHSCPLIYTLLKVIGISAFVCKTFICISAPPEFGKTSIFNVIHSLTKKSPVFTPRRIPKILYEINTDGNMVFDEICSCQKDVKDCTEEFSLRVADGSPNYINGALKSTYTRNSYDVHEQSITYLYNLKKNYKNETDFFDNIFVNNDAIDSRFLKLKMEGIMTEQFDKDFNILKMAEENKLYYIGIAKQLLFLKQLRLINAYQRRFTDNTILSLKGRRKATYDEITWLLDMYCKTQEEYDMMITILDDCIIKYKQMAGEEIPLKREAQQTIEIETIKVNCYFCKSPATKDYRGKDVCDNCWKNLNQDVKV